MNEFTRQYIETALWASIGDDGEPLSVEFTADDLSPETLAQIIEDCDAFLDGHFELIRDNFGRAGQDFFLTRNRHGEGFWNGDWRAVAGHLLVDASHDYGTFKLYVGDDGRIYHG